MTFQHGDTGAHNTYHLPDGRCGFLDWQLSVRGHWSHDVHYLVTTALSVADRRAHEKALVERYLARLAALGVADVPPIDEAMREFGRALIWGFTIGWLMVPPQNYPASIIGANLERLLAAVQDHGTFDLADEVTPA
jgi:aminoglycoside phosphotransferase (APT) family kinase protein